MHLDYFTIFRDELYFFASELDRFKIQCDGEDKTTEQKRAIDNFHSCINRCISQGLTRKDLYQILRTLLDTLEFTDELIELESSIIGWCSSESIIRFKEDPKDEDELLEYVRNNLWK